MKLFKWQKEFIKSCFENNYVIVLSSRQIGKSTAVAYFSVLYSILHPSSIILLISPSLRQSLLLHKKVLEIFHSTNIFEQYIAHEQATKIETITKSTIVSLPNSPHTIRGYSADVVIVDEANFIDEEILSEIIMPMLATKKSGKLILISTPYTKDHIFYQFLQSEKFIKHIYTYEASPLITKEFIEMQQKILPKWVFEQEYLAQYPNKLENLFSVPSDIIIEPREEPISYTLIDLGGLANDLAIIYLAQINDTFIVVNSVAKKVDTYEKINEPVYGKVIVDAGGVGRAISEFQFKEATKVIWNKKLKMEAINHVASLIINKKILIMNTQNNMKLVEQLKRYTYDSKNNDDLVEALLLSIAIKESFIFSF